MESVLRRIPPAGKAKLPSLICAGPSAPPGPRACFALILFFRLFIFALVTKL